MKMLNSLLGITCEKPFSPSPRLRGEGAGGCGAESLGNAAPSPHPLPRKARGEGGDTRVTLHSFKTLIWPSVLDFHQASRGGGTTTRGGLLPVPVSTDHCNSDNTN
jgi:hypothetical protein